MSIVKLRIGRTYNGPPDSANGGYVCGLIASKIDGDAQITLRKPPPLETELYWDLNTFKLSDEAGVLIAEAKSTVLQLEVPDPPSLEEAQQAKQHYAGFAYHAFPSCFVCGPARPKDNGLHIYAGPLEKTKDIVVSDWIPSSKWCADQSNHIRPEFVWAALDCPGAFAVMERKVPMVLGRMTAKVLQPVIAGVPSVIAGWKIGSEGRKSFTGTALWQHGQLMAFAKSVWISLISK